MSGSVNQHIVSYLNFYLAQPEPPRYAVLISGAWGSGKTWLIRRYFASIPEQKSLYISLYGAKTADEIAERIFAARHPILASKGAVIAGRLIKGLLKVTTSIDLDGDKKDDVQIRPDLPEVMDTARKNPVYTNVVLIFDDVERALVGENELWGFMNQLVEHEGAKVIVLSCEKVIDDKDGSYRRTKEKNIGITLSVLPDAESALQSLGCELHDDVADVITAHRMHILQMFERSGCANLRVLRFAIRDFCRIFMELPSKLQDDSEIVNSLLDSTLMLACGVYSGEIKPEDLTPVYLAISPDKNEEKPLAKLFRKYESSMSALFPPLSWWRTFLERGELRREAIDEAHKRLIGDVCAPNWLRLAEFDKLSDSEFESLLDETWGELTTGQNRSLGAILHVAATHMWAVKNGVTTSSRSLLVIRDEVKKSVNLLEDGDILQIVNPHDPDRASYSFAGIAYAAYDFPEFQELLKHVDQLIVTAKSVIACLDARCLLKLMMEDGDGFAQALGEGPRDDGQLKSVSLCVSVLAEIDPAEFAKNLAHLDVSSQVQIVLALRGRINRSLPREREWLGRVVEKLQEQKSKPSLQSHMLCMRLSRLVK